MKKFTIVDYLIIFLVICAVIFAFIHITSDDSSNTQKTAYDTSTFNKIPDTYSNYYKDGYIVNATIKGFNSSTNEELTINGTVEWIGNEGGTNIKILVNANNTTYTAGLYKSVPKADIYIDTISLEVDGSKYDNLVEFKANPKNITSLNDLVKDLNDTDFEISTTVSLDSIDAIKYQEIINKLYSQNDRIAIHTYGADLDNQIILEKADMKAINDGSSVLGNINGLTDEITIRVYNCSDSQMENIKNNYDIINIRKF